MTDKFTFETDYIRTPLYKPSLDPDLKGYIFEYPEFDYRNFSRELSLLESTDSSDKPGLFKTLLEKIKKLWSWICTQLTRFVNWIKGLFRKKSKSAEQIAMDLGIKNKPVNMTDSKSLAGIKDLTIQFKENDNMVFTVSELAKLDYEKDAPVPGHMRPRHIKQAMTMMKMDKYDTNVVLVKDWGFIFTIIKNSHYLDEVIKLFNDISNRSEIPVSKLRNVIELIQQQQDIELDEKKRSVEVKLSELIEFQKKLNLLDSIFIKIDDPEYMMQVDKRLPQHGVGEVKSFLMFYIDFSLHLQLAMNKVFTAVQDIYRLDNTYKNMCGDPEKLSAFANHCIHSGFPGKYVANNLYTAATDDVKGDWNDPSDPKLGQFRVAFKPKPKGGSPNTVLKIATNHGGIRGNTNEVRISRIMEKTNGSHLIARVLTSYADNTGISTEYAEHVEAGHQSDIAALKLGGAINTHLQTNSNTTIHDIHSENIGILNGKYVAFDYGWLIKKIK